MAQSRRRISAFSLSFLDIMSCGFGAAVLLFLIIKHNVDTNVPQPVVKTDLSAEVDLLEEEIIIKIADLGYARAIQQQEVAKTGCGTPL